jgi:hypothetical protein
MRLKNTYFLSLFLLAGTVIFAQEKVDSLKSWKLKSLYSLSGTQSSFVNWNSGGRNNISMIGSIGASAYYTKNNVKWTNDVSLALGGIKYLDNISGVGLQKTDDRIDLASTFGLLLSKDFFLTIAAGFKTQMVNGFSYPNDSVVVSTFMAPGYLNLALGTDLRKGDQFSVFFSSIAIKSTFVMDDSLSAAGAFGVEKGARYRQEYGAFLKMKWNRNLAKNIEMKSKLELFSNYLNNPQNIDVNAELLFVFRVNSLFSATAQWNLVYDDDIKIRDIHGGFGPRTQFKSVLGIGISYKLENN